MIAENQYKRKLRLPKWLPSQSEGEKRLIFFAVKKQNNILYTINLAIVLYG